MQARQNIRRAAQPSSGSAMQRWRPAFIPTTATRNTIDRIRAMGARLGDEAYQRQRAIVRTSDAELLCDIRCPTVVIASIEDRVRTVGESETLARGIPNAALVTIQGVGHLIPIEAPSEMVAAIAPILEQAAALR
jgi:pimeloyl-ACP methyl ester carboxylesterase